MFGDQVIKKKSSSLTKKIYMYISKLTVSMLEIKWVATSKVNYLNHEIIKLLFYSSMYNKYYF